MRQMPRKNAKHSLSIEPPRPTFTHPQISNPDLMSVEIPSSLIRQIQSTLRRNAGIPSSYDPADPDLPSLPSLQDAISALDSDPSIAHHPRCGKCRRAAGLLRGAHSTLCIFCGRDRRLDGVELSVSFNSTVACKKLLESLQLDGSEVIDLETEPNDSSKGQDKQYDVLVLSDILDLELKWPPKKEEAVSSSYDKTPASVQAVNLSGVDLDSFFSHSNNRTASGAPRVTSEESMSNKQIISTESYASSGTENFAGSKDLQTQDIGVSSANNRGGDELSVSFADWNGGFQSASSPVSHAESVSTDDFHGSSTTGLASSVTDVAVAAEPKPVDLFEDSTIEFSSHATPTSTFSKHSLTEHEISNEAGSREPTEEWGHFSSGANWIQDDHWPNKADQLQTTGKTIDSHLSGDAQCMTSAGDTWGQDEMWSTSNMKASNTKNNDDAFDDSLDSWQDFASSNTVPGFLSSSWTQSGNEIASKEHASSSSKTVDLQDLEFSNFMRPDSFAGALGEQRSPSEVNDVQLKASASTSNIDKSIDENSLETLQDFTRCNEASGDLLNSWAQTTSEAGLNKQAAITKSADPQDMEFGSFLLSDSFSGRLGSRKDQKDPSEEIAMKLEPPVSTDSINKHDNTNQIVDNDDSLEAWQGFTSLKEASGVMANSSTSSFEASIKHTPGVKYVDLQDSEFGSFVHSDPFSGADGLKSSTYVDGMPLDALVSMSKVTNQSDDNDDSWDAWQDFTSSKELPNLRTSVSEASTKHAPRVKSVDLQDSEFGSFVFSDSFSGMDGQKSSADVSDVQLDDFVSKLNATFESSNGMNDNDGFFGSWKDAANFGEVPKGLPNLSAQASTEITSYEHISGVNSVDVEDMEFGGFLQSDMFSGEDSNKANDVQLDAVVSASKIKEFDNAKIMDGNDDPFGGFLPSDMFSGMRLQEDSSKANDIQLDAFVSTSSVKEFNNTKNMNGNNDPFEAWQNFISSNDAQGSSANQSTQSDTTAISYEYASRTKSLDLEDMGFGSFLCSDSLPGALGGERGSSEVNEMQKTSSSCRTSRTDETTRGVSDIPGAAAAHENKILASNHESTNSKIEMLLAKMPDLSFMLEDNLSIPKKTDNSNLKS